MPSPASGTAFDGYATQFLAPPTAEDPRPAPAVSDCGEAAMRRLRHPFAVVADTVPHTAGRGV